MKEFILASKSPRRKTLLRNLIDIFLIINPDIEESQEDGENPEDYVLRIALNKARAAAEIAGSPSGDNWIVIAADTIVVFEDTILGKPADERQAARILAKLRGRTHQVYSGIAVYDLARNEYQTRIVCSEVEMREYTEKEISEYVASGDPMDKAGAYAIQNRVFNPAPGFQNCYANVMGLPLCHLAVLMKEMNCAGHIDVADRCQKSIQYRCPIFSSILAERNGKDIK